MIFEKDWTNRFINSNIKDDFKLDHHSDQITKTIDFINALIKIKTHNLQHCYGILGVKKKNNNIKLMCLTPELAF